MEKLKILVVESKPEKVELIQNQLNKRFDITLDSVGDETSFVKKLKEIHPDFILANYYTPGTDGIRLIHWRNQIVPEVPFVLLTEEVEDELALEVFKEGASEYIAYKHILRLGYKLQKLLEQKKLYSAKKTAEQKLQRSFQQLQAFIENDISGVYIEVNDEITYCNKKLLEIFEFDSLEQLNAFKPVNLYEHPQQRDEVNAILKSGKKVINKELNMHTRNGKKRIVLENAFAELDSGGNLVQVHGFLQDITDLKKAEVSLKESEALFKTLVQTTNAGVIVYNQNSFLVVNPAFCALSGYTEEELLSMHYWEVVHPDHVEIIKKRGKERISGKNPISHYQFKILTKQGETKWIDYSAAPITFRGENAAVGTLFDITQLKKTTHEYKKLSTIVEQSPITIVVTDLNARIEFVNEAFTETTGYTFDEVKGKNPKILKSGLTPEVTYKELWANLANGKSWKGEFINRKKNEENYIEWAYLFPLMDENDNIIQYAALKMDITQQRKLEEQLRVEKEKVEEANKLKTAILTNMSHELRTPLNGILGFSTLIADMEDLNEIREMVGYINESGQRLLRTLNLVIDVSRLEAGNFVPKYETIDLVTVAEQVINHFKDPAQQKGLVLSFDPAQRSCVIRSDLKFVTDSLENLIDNAIKYTNEGYIRVTISNEEREGRKYKLISVKDTGIGISKENQKLIFEDFQQESVGYGRIYEGMGLGLSIARKYMELLGGYIDLKSEVGKGSEFIMHIPEDTK